MRYRWRRLVSVLDVWDWQQKTPCPSVSEGQTFRTWTENGKAVKHLITKTPWPESASKLYRPSDSSLSAKLVPTFADRKCHVAGVTDPYGHVLSFLEWASDRWRILNIVTLTWVMQWWTAAALARPGTGRKNSCSICCTWPHWTQTFCTSLVREMWPIWDVGSFCLGITSSPRKRVLTSVECQGVGPAVWRLG
jgi:hypothetical protein